MENRETRQLSAKMTRDISRSTLGSSEAVKARRTTSPAVRNAIVIASGTVRDSGNPTT